MVGRSAKIDVVALVPDRDAMRAWFAIKDPIEQEASIADTRDKFCDVIELASVQRQVTGVFGLLKRGARDEVEWLCRPYPDDSGIDLSYATALLAFHSDRNCNAAQQAF